MVPISDNNGDLQFLYNLANTAYQGQLIRSDGAKLNLWNRLVDFIFRRQRHDHLATVCQRLAACSKEGTIKNLTYEQRADIVGRLEQIAWKLRDDKVATGCRKNMKVFTKTALAELPATPDYFTSDLLKGISENTSGKTGFSAKLLALKQVVYLHKDNSAFLAQLIPSFTEALKHYQEELTQNRGYRPLHQGIIFKSILIQLGEKIEVNSDEGVVKSYLACLDAYLKVVFNDFDRGDLYDRFFSARYALKKQKDLFEIADRLLPVVKDTELETSLQLGFASLDCEDRSKYPNLILSNQKQLDLLIGHFQKNEDQAIDQLIWALQKVRGLVTRLSSSDIHRLNRLVSDQSYLSDANREKLRKAICPDATDWSIPQGILSGVKIKKSESKPYCLIENLKRYAKAKFFFESQKKEGRSENEIMIPRWYYHMSHESGNVLALGRIDPASNPPDDAASPSVEILDSLLINNIAFPNQITQMELTGNSKFHGAGVRRIKSAVPLERNPSNFMFIVANTIFCEQTAKQETKVHAQDMLKRYGYNNTKVVTQAQMHFMHKEIRTCLRIPNIPHSWW